MKSERKVFSNTIYLALDWFFTSLMSFIFWFILGKTLLPEYFGIVSTSINLALLMSVVSFIGFGGTIMKLTPEYLKNNQTDKIVELNKFTLKILLVSNLSIIILILLFSQFISTVFKVPLAAIYLSSILLFSFTVSNFLGSILYGFQNIKKIFVTDFVGGFSKVVLTIIFIFLGLQFLGPILAVLLSFLLVALFRFNKSYFKNYKTPDINRKLIFYEFSLPFFFSNLSLMAFSSSYSIIIPLLKTQEIMGYFSIALLLTSIIGVVPQVLSNAVFPVTSELNIGKKTKKQSYLINLIIRYSIFLALPLAIVFTIFSKPLILFFSRGEYLQASNLFPILSAAALFFGVGVTILSSLYALGKTKIFRNIWLISAFLYLSLSVILTIYLSVLGTALAYLISALVLAISSYFYLKKYLELNTIINLIKILISGLLLTLIIGSTTVVNLPFPTKFLIAAIGLLTYILILLPLRFYTKEDFRILNFAIRKIPLINNFLLKISDYISKYI